MKRARTRRVTERPAKGAPSTTTTTVKTEMMMEVEEERIERKHLAPHRTPPTKKRRLRASPSNLEEEDAQGGELVDPEEARVMAFVTHEVKELPAEIEEEEEEDDDDDPMDLDVPVVDPRRPKTDPMLLQPMTTTLYFDPTPAAAPPPPRRAVDGGCFVEAVQNIAHDLRLLPVVHGPWTVPADVLGKTPPVIAVVPPPLTPDETRVNSYGCKAMLHMWLGAQQWVLVLTTWAAHGDTGRPDYTEAAIGQARIRLGGLVRARLMNAALGRVGCTIDLYRRRLDVVLIVTWSPLSSATTTTTVTEPAAGSHSTGRVG